MLKKPVTSRRSPSENRASTSALLTWSASTTASARANQRQALSMNAALPGAVEVRLAAAAERLLVHIRPIVPATLALAVRARLDLDLRGAAMHMGGGGEHDEFQVFAQAAQDLEVFSLGVELDLRLER